MKTATALFLRFSRTKPTHIPFAAISVVMVLATLATARADTLQVLTDTSWRAIGPVGNLEGNPINSVGLAWEAAHPGWDNSLGFDDSAGAGWNNSIASPNRGVNGTPSYAIWSDGNGSNGSTPSYFRKAFFLGGAATAATLHMEVDDDAQVYVNGTLVIDDHSGTADNNPFDVDITGNLVAGENLVAVKANDSFGGSESLSLALQIQYVPEPSIFGLTGLGTFALFACRRRK